ncbi:hypothetical protein [Conexibacter sp. DBS9H8]|uniref:hypothetical protein n=1 Tax=Conexibacter sp. DBS9H8 TaxID=2937801 RepID=UPI00200FE7D2|nr:hypothetical protein [Conexibacter sp. DBS9H8]
MTGAVALLLTVQLAATAAMVAIIWFVQLVHYPLLARVGSSEFVAYETANTRRTAWVVGPPMLAEAVTAVIILLDRPGRVSAALAAAGVACLLLLWVSTGLVQSPLHGRLSRGRDLTLIRRLVVTNWVRTVLWSLRLLIAAAMLLGAGRPHG